MKQFAHEDMDLIGSEGKYVSWVIWGECDSGVAWMPGAASMGCALER